MALSTNRKNRVLRAPATNDSCDISEGDPEGSPFAFWFPFRRDRVLRIPDLNLHIDTDSVSSVVAHPRNQRYKKPATKHRGGLSICCPQRAQGYRQASGFGGRFRQGYGRGPPSPPVSCRGRGFVFFKAARVSPDTAAAARRVTLTSGDRARRQAPRLRKAFEGNPKCEPLPNLPRRRSSVVF